MAYAATIARKAVPIAVANRIALFLARSFRVESNGRFTFTTHINSPVFDVGVGRDEFAVALDARLLRNHALEILVFAVLFLDRPMVLAAPLLALSRTSTAS